MAKKKLLWIFSCNNDPRLDCVKESLVLDFVWFEEVSCCFNSFQFIRQSFFVCPTFSWKEQVFTKQFLIILKHSRSSSSQAWNHFLVHFQFGSKFCLCKIPCLILGSRKCWALHIKRGPCFLLSVRTSHLLL